MREHVEKHREEIELSGAVATLMLAKTHALRSAKF